VVWVGYDDNRASRLSGAAAALPVWGEMMAALDLEPLVLPKPDTIEHVWIDPHTGLRADSGCADARELPFAQGSAPAERSPCTGDVPARFKGWLERIFGR